MLRVTVRPRRTPLVAVYPPGTGTDGQRTIRILTAAPVALLMMCIATFGARGGPVGTSLSAYYGGPMRDVFVGSLVATALALVAYRGTNDLEDLALDAAGFFAPFVAFVPWNLAWPTTPGAVEQAVDVKAVLSCYLAVACAVFLTHRRGLAVAGARLWHSSATTRGLVVLAVLGILAEVTLVVVRLFEPRTVFAGVHDSAAFLLMASLGIAIASQVVAPRHRGLARDEGDHPPRALTITYCALLGCMAVGGPAIWLGLRSMGVPAHFFWAEMFEFGLFLAYWGCELWRHWGADAPARGVRRRGRPEFRRVRSGLG